MRNFGGNYIEISFSGPTTSRRPVDRPLTGLETLCAASNPWHARLEAILGASQAKTARHRPLKLVLKYFKHTASVEGPKVWFCHGNYLLTSTEP
jgi:hypothetical protein